MKKTLIGVAVAGMMVLGSPLAANAQYGNGHTPITFCHKPGTPAQQTLTTDAKGWNGHSKHGDTLGECGPLNPSPEPSSEPDPDPDPEPEEPIETPEPSPTPEEPETPTDPPTAPEEPEVPAEVETPNIVTDVPAAPEPAERGQMLAETGAGDVWVPLAAGLGAMVAGWFLLRKRRDLKSHG